MITPLLEKYILEGKAVFKNTSIGENGLLALEIPRGSTAIITKIIIEPFINFWAELDDFGLNTYLNNLGINAGTHALINMALLNRCEYNLKVYSESGKVKINYNLRQEIEIDYYEEKTQLGVNHTYFNVVKPKLNVREIDCYILANETIFFMYSFPDWAGSTVSCFTDTFPNTFNNTTPVPISPNGPDVTTPEVFNYFLGGNSVDVYLPMGKNTTIEINTAPKTNEIYRGDTATSELRVPNNTPPGSVIKQDQNYSLPLLNIEYVLINSGLGSLKNPGNEGI